MRNAEGREAHVLMVVEVLGLSGVFAAANIEIEYAAVANIEYAAKIVS